MNAELNSHLVEEAKKQGVHRYVVGAVVAKNARVLLLQRPQEDFMGGIYELPSGKVEAGETLSDALYREIEEETGLKIEKIDKYLGHFDYESKSGKATRQFNYVVTVFEPTEIQLQEHDKYVWINRNQLEQCPVTESVKSVLSLFWAEVEK